MSDKNKQVSASEEKKICTHLYSRSINQSYPRKCIECGEPEKPIPSSDYKEITGFDTPQELSAYEQGRIHEAKTIIEWIGKWNGATTSVLGEALDNKFKQLNANKNKLSIVTALLEERKSLTNDFLQTSKSYSGYDKIAKQYDTNVKYIDDQIIKVLTTETKI